MTMTRKFFYRTLSGAYLGLFFFFVLAGYAPAASDKEIALVPEHGHTIQCIRIVRALEQFHYTEKMLDNTMSSMILDRYLKQLDPGKKTFTLREIESIKQYRYRMDDQLKRGNLQPVFKIFNFYLSRSIDRLDYILSLIKTWETQMDFTRDESLIIENDIRQWQPDLKALKNSWRQDLKNHIITMLLDEKDSKYITDQLEKLYTNRKKRLLQTNATDVFQIFMNTVTASFDPHTQFFAPRASEDFAIHMSLSLEGIGAVLQNEYDYTKVVRLIPKGPADKSNLLMPGDKIIGVGQGADGEITDTIGQRIDNVVKLIRGPKNTIVRLKIIPAKKSSVTKTIQIVRDKVKLEDQSAKKDIITFEQNNKMRKIGVIEIPTFYKDFDAIKRGEIDHKSVSNDVKKLLIQLKSENIDGLIIDLRDNGGGSLDEANLMTGLFLKSGPIVQVKDKYETNRKFDHDPDILYSGPLVVLINRMSASASEIFAGAIKDYNRGVIVGTRSFGKGTVQFLQALGTGRLKLTSAKFYRITGESTQHRGVLPDIGFPQLYKIEDTGESSLDGALPWDTINKTYYKPYRSLKPVLAKLEDAYRERSNTNPELAYLNQRIKLASAINDETYVSLNIEKRKARQKEYESQELLIENRYLLAAGKPSIQELVPEEATIKNTKSILMEQTYSIMSDLINCSNDLGYQW